MFEMRCFNTTTFELHSAEQHIFKTQGYAILSHRWIEDEIIFRDIRHYYQELKQTTGRHPMPQLDKIYGACVLARYQGIKWMWIDSCCINKSSSREESESISSMFKWYSDAAVCITYLMDVVKKPNVTEGPEIFNTSEGKPSVWFKRGWTLQELIAPKNIQFYDMNWDFLGTKAKLAVPLSEITGIAASYLTFERDFREACIAAKMSWMAGRETGREEDLAYSMMGIFGITMTLQYGEGMGAFARLQEILLGQNDESLFAWKMPPEGPGNAHRGQMNHPFDLGPNEWGLLAASPHWFANCYNMTIRGVIRVRHRGGFTKTQQGISGPIGKRDHLMTAFLSGVTVVGVIPFQIWLAVRDRTVLKFSLNCWEMQTDGKMKAVEIVLRPIFRNPRIYIRTDCQTYNLISGSVKDTGYSNVGTVFQP